MAVDHLAVAPSVDLHLIKGGGGIPLTITAYSYNPYNENDVTATVIGTLSFATAGVAQVTGTTISPIAVGESLAVISYVDPAGSGTHYLLLRVRVHNSIQSIWFGNNKVGLFTSETCLLSVYAKFDDNSWGDVSSHPFLNFNSNDTSKVTVDATGLLTAVAAGSTMLDVTGPGTDHVIVSVQDPTTPNPILERIWGSGPHAERRNLLILAEGFTTADQPLFDQWKLEIQKRLLQTKSHSPYNLLKDSWNVWAAFEPSSETGISVGSQVTVPDGNNFVREYDFSHPDANGPRILQAKDSRYALRYGARPGERSSMMLTTAPVATDWYKPWRPYREIGEDPRRTGTPGTKAYIGRLTAAYLDSLKNKAVATGDPEYDIGKTWKWKFAAIAASPGGAAQAGNVVTITTTGAHGLNVGDQVQLDDVESGNYNGVQTIQSVPSPTTFTYNLLTTGLGASGGGWVSGVDRGLVAVVVYDDRDGGAQFGRAFAVSLGRQSGFHSVTGSGSALDHDPLPSNVVLDAVGAVFAHEMAHALGLGDEYEGYDLAGHTTLSGNTAEDKQIEQNGNLTVFDTIAPDGALNSLLIKWNWDRMTQSSRLAQDLAPPSGTTMDIVLKTGEGKKWAKAQTDGTDVFLRRRVVDQAFSNPVLSREGPFKVTNINGDTVTIQGAAGTTEFKTGSVLYIPKKDSSGNIITLIPSQVAAFIQANGAFPRPDNNCLHFIKSSEDPPNIPGFHYPRHNRDLVGLYTGGGTWNCNVFRPCGYCKMRQAWYWDQQWSWWPPGEEDVVVIPDFCFVCKYYIVDLIDSGQHQLLDKEYPEDC